MSATAKGFTPVESADENSVSGGIGIDKTDRKYGKKKVQRGPPVTTRIGTDRAAEMPGHAGCFSEFTLS